MLKGIEIKSAMTYNTSFEKALRKMESLVADKIAEKVVVYDGDFENEVGEIKILNYRHLSAFL